MKLQKKALGKKISISCFFLLLISFSCNSYTKVDYLKDYEHFIIDVKRDWQSYSEKKWEKIEVINSEYYYVKFKKFAAELSIAERIRINRFNFVFHFYKGDINLKSLLSGDYNDILIDTGFELNEIIQELQLAINDLESERTDVIINKLLE